MRLTDFLTCARHPPSRPEVMLRFTCMVRGRQAYLFLYENGWYMERKQKAPSFKMYPVK